MTHVIEVKNLIKHYRKSDRNAIDDVSFFVKEGDFFSLLGPNGAGKTTTISILTTTLTKTSGQVLINGYDLDSQATQIRQSIGIIFQNPSLDQNLTAEENVRLHAMFYDLYPFRPSYSLMPKPYKDKVGELARVLDIEAEMFKPVKSFSGGMKRKLEIIRSLIHNPKVLFLDEPTTGLDPLSRRNLWEYLQEVRNKHRMTVFLTTHYLEEAESADYVCVINHGKLVSWGTPSTIKSDLVENYMIVDADHREKLATELEKLKVTVLSKRPFKVRLNNHTAQEVIKGITVPLKRLEIHTPTLEEAYLEIIREKNSQEHENMKT